MKTQRQLIERASELVKRDHGGCDQNTCDLSVALRHGFELVAIERWAGTGASCDEFDLIYDKLGSKFHRDQKAELRKLLKLPAVKCPHCCAFLWLPDECEYYCDSCDNDIPQPAEAV